MISTLRVALAVVVLLACQLIGWTVVPVKVSGAENVFGWVLLSDLTMVIALTIAVANSGWSKKLLALSIFAVLAPIQLADVLEGSVFLKTLIPWGRIAVQAVITYALVAVPLALVLTIRRKPIAIEPPIRREWTSWVWRYVAAVALYPVLYFLFGVAILPWIRDFYATQTVPPAGTIIALQFFVRGPIFVAVALLLAAMVQRRQEGRAWLTGICFTLLSGFAPLIIPNPFFPNRVRYAHLFEVTTENFILAAFAGYLWYKKQHAPKRQEVTV